MERKVEIVNGPELTKEQVTKILNIYRKTFNNDYYIIMNKIISGSIYKEMENLFNESIDNLYFILGEDWMFVYAINYEYIDILLWSAIKNEYKMIQSVEMYNAIIKLLTNNKESLYEAEMTHSTSYQFYLLLFEKGYFEEINHYINGYDLNFIQSLLLKLVSKSNNPDKLIDNRLLFCKRDRDKISHDILFTLSDSFIKSEENKRVLKKM